MKIVISTDGEQVSAHFGRCPSFTIVEIENNKIVSKSIIDNPGHHPGFLPEFLQAKGVNVIVAGGMGQRAQILFEQSNIQTIMGIVGPIESVLEKLCLSTLQGGASLCNPGAGKGYGVEKTECDHPHEDDCEHEKKR